jgi:Flp pilus assembly protein TadD
MSGNTGQALTLIQQFVALQPLEPEGYFWLGLALDESDQPEQAVAAYKQAVTQALTVGMDSAELHTSLGNTLLKLGQLDDAQGEFDRALELEPKSITARLSLARALIAKQQGQPALDALKKCERADAPREHLHYYRAKALKLTGNVQGAQTEAMQALQFVQDAGARAAIAAEFGLAAPP